MRGNSGTGRQRGNSHNLRYWRRLKRQFEHCAYDHTGAYSSLKIQAKSREMRQFQRDLEDAETVMATKRYQRLKERLLFNGRPDRLRAVANLKLPV